MGHVFFSGSTLETLPGRVMTPRPATEQLVALAVERIGERHACIADVGTGSGAIAVCTALGARNAEVWATDVSAEAVLLARRNARRLGVSDRVHVVKGDLLAPVPGVLDLIVANLPYLPRGDRAHYPDLRAEPENAVFANGDGLDLLRRLLCSAEERLTPTGAVVLQLHRRVLIAERAALAALRERLAAPPALAA